jgi:hypothetical protein
MNSIMKKRYSKPAVEFVISTEFCQTTGTSNTTTTGTQSLVHGHEDGGLNVLGGPDSGDAEEE